MKPILKMIEEKTVVGCHIKLSFAQYNVGSLWSAFMKRRNEITNNVNTDLISLAEYKSDFYKDFRPTNLFEKWAAIEVTTTTDIPKGMDSFVIPAGLYAIFHYKGLNTDFSIFDYIFKTWLPGSEYELDDRPHFEILGEKYKNNDPDSEEDIYIPVKLKI